MKKTTIELTIIDGISLSLILSNSRLGSRFGAGVGNYLAISYFVVLAAILLDGKNIIFKT